MCLANKSSMFCDYKTCENTFLKILESAINLEELHLISNRCNQCYEISNADLAKKISFQIDIKFAENIIFHFENIKKAKEFAALLQELKNSIVKHNCLNENEEQKITKLICSSVKKGEITMLKKQKKEVALNG